MRLPRWKKEQKKRKEKKRISLTRKVFFLISLILLVGIGYQAWKSLRKSIWDGENRITLVLNSNPILVTSFNPGDKTLSLLSISGNTYLETIHGYGFYKAESIWQLGELENYGGELLAGSLQEYLGVPIDAYASVSRVRSWESGVGSQESGVKPKEYLLSVVRTLIGSGGQTNLTRWDLIRLWWGTKRVRFDKVRLVDLGKTNAVEEITLPDGTKALEPDPLRLDHLVVQLFPDSKLKNEGLSIGVFNATDHLGLAKKSARLINNIGGQVIEVGDWGEKSQESRVRSQESNLKKYTTQKIMKVLDCQYEGSEMGESQVELLVIVGENYWQRLTEK